MLSREEGLAIAQRAVAMSEADETEIRIAAADSALTRYASNAITQNRSSSTTSLNVRLLLGDQVGQASTNQLDDAAIGRAVTQATEAARQTQPDPKVAHLVDGEREYQETGGYDEPTARWTAKARAEAIVQACQLAADDGLEAAGSFQTSASCVALATSRGVAAYSRGTDAAFAITATGEGVSGWAQQAGHQAGALDASAQARRAVSKALTGRHPQPIEPGSYTVILEPEAVTDFLVFMTSGFGGKVCSEGRSFLSGKLGSQVLGRNITITDDPYHPDLSGLPFDFEGAPRQKVTLIENGVATGLVHDTQSGAEAGVASTGHAMPQPNAQGAMPMNLVLAGGDTSIEQMIESTDRAILVTHFHYTNVLDPVRLVLTGMTRDGTYLVENGRIKHPVRNLRFTHSVVDALNQVEQITENAIYTSGFFGGGYLVPGMKINGFTFTSATEF